MTEEEVKLLMKLPIQYRKVKLNETFYEKCTECPHYVVCIEKKSYNEAECGRVVINNGVGYLKKITPINSFPVRVTATLSSKGYIAYLLYEEVDSLINIEPLRRLEWQKKKLNS